MRTPVATPVVDTIQNVRNTANGEHNNYTRAEFSRKFDSGSGSQGRHLRTYYGKTTLRCASKKIRPPEKTRHIPTYSNIYQHIPTTDTHTDSLSLSLLSYLFFLWRPFALSSLNFFDPYFFRPTAAHTPAADRNGYPRWRDDRFTFRTQSRKRWPDPSLRLGIVGCVPGCVCGFFLLICLWLRGCVWFSVFLFFCFFISLTTVFFLFGFMLLGLGACTVFFSVGAS